jgi:hypothetical protein
MVEFRPLDMGRGSLTSLVSEAARWGQRRLRDCVPHRVILARRYRRTYGRALDLRNPQTFNEKLYSVRARGRASSFHPRTTATGARRSSYRARSGSEINIVGVTGPGSA